MPNCLLIYSVRPILRIGEYSLVADGRVGVRSLMHLRDRSRPHISAALPVHAIMSSPGERRERRGEQLAVSHTGA